MRYFTEIKYSCFENQRRRLSLLATKNTLAKCSGFQVPQERLSLIWTNGPSSQIEDRKNKKAKGYRGGGKAKENRSQNETIKAK